ncbi:MAG: NAD-dependent epimerase/dehydratase family protein [Kiloniellales bacterium]
MTRLNLVTGGAGFIGSHLVRLLAESGERVRILDIADPGPVAPGVEVIRGSITDAETVRRSLIGVDRLYHLAANPELWTRDPLDYVRVNIEGTRIVLDEAARRDLERIVFTSTESVLKSHRQAHVNGSSDGSAELSLDDMAGPYCRSKFLAERLAFAAIERGQPIVVVNPTMPVGPGDHHMTPPMQMLLRFLEGKAPAYLESEFNLIHVRDAAVGHVLAADKGRIGERYVLGAENLKLSEVIAILGEISGLPMPRHRIPYWLAITTATISELISDRITGRPPVAPVTGVRLAATSLSFDCSKAVRELGLPQTPARQALAEAFEWFVREGRLKRRLPRRSLETLARLGQPALDATAQAGGDRPAAM